MSKNFTLTSYEEEAPINQSDLTSGKLVLRQRGVNGALLANKQRVNIYLDSAIVEHFKSQAGGRGYQTLINEALKQALQTESIEAVIKKTIQEELRKH